MYQRLRLCCAAHDRHVRTSRAAGRRCACVACSRRSMHLHRDGRQERSVGQRARQRRQRVARPAPVLLAGQRHDTQCQVGALCLNAGLF